MYTYPKGCIFKTTDDIQQKKITIMGLGLNGGGEACVRFFLKHGAFVVATDMKTEQQLASTIERLKDLPCDQKERLTYRLGKHEISDFTNADCVIKNPGVKIEGNAYLKEAKHIETDLSVFLALSKAPVIAVTGSKGKSSTVSAIHYGLTKAGFKTFLGGNITVSPLTFLEQTDSTTPVVLELSSWQLADLRGRGVLCPKISLITKIVPDHLNWYGTMESYIADKRLIYKDQTANDYAIFDAGRDEPGTEPQNADSWGTLFASEATATVLRYSKTPLSAGTYGVWQEQNADGSFIGKILLSGMNEPQTTLTTLKVPGAHMRANALNAALVMNLMGVQAEKTAKILSEWQGIDHRLQFFHSYTAKNGKTYAFYNDTCATVPEAAVQAAKAFGKPVILLCGGTDKGLSFNALTDFLCKKRGTSQVKALYLLSGSGTQKIMPKLTSNNVLFKGPFDSLSDLLAALKNDIDGVTQNKQTSQDTAKSQNKAIADPDAAIPVVFSPGATSFGMFANEFDRGTKFMQGVKESF